jgi:hypothetical protein
MTGRYPRERTPPGRDAPRVDGLQWPPGRWQRGINLERRLPGGRDNCGERARSAHSAWHGWPAAAAALSEPRSGGEHAGRMAEGAGRRPVPAAMTQIGRRLADLGPGSSAIVGCARSPGAGAGSTP